MYSLANKVVFITGASGGIGAALAAGARARGALVVSTDLPPVDSVAGKTVDAQGRPTYLSVDVTDPKSVAAAVTTVVDAYGRLDVAIANAGVTSKQLETAAVTSDAQFDIVQKVNVYGVWNTVRAVLPAVTEARGHVLMTASIHSFMNGVGAMPYAASKAAVAAMARALRVELSGSGATAGVLIPAIVATPISALLRGGDDLATELSESVMPSFMRGVSTPEDIAEAALRGIEKRSRSTVPSLPWRVYHFLFSALNPFLDAAVEKSPVVHRILSRVEAKVAAAAA